MMGEGTPITPRYITPDPLRTSAPVINILSWFRETRPVDALALTCRLPSLSPAGAPGMWVWEVYNRQKKGAQPLRVVGRQKRVFSRACREGSRHERTTSSARRGALPMKSDVVRF